MIELITSPEAWISLLTLTAMEIVLGIDNIVFITILANKLPTDDRAKTRQLGLIFALATRLLLLFSVRWISSLTEPWFSAFGIDFSGRSVILLCGGLFLIAKATLEIFESLEVREEHEAQQQAARSVISAILQIMVIDIVFSLDSVITAVGMAKHLEVMVAAMVIAVAIMALFATPVGNFIDRHPSFKVLALSFLLLIGVLLTAESFGQHINKGYIYFAMGFSLAVEMLNIRIRKSRMAPVKLHRNIGP